MNGRLVLSIALGLALLGPGSISYAEQNKLIGSVSAVDAGAGSFSVAESAGARAMDFRVDDDSRITSRGSRKTVKLADLALGSAVSVTYDPADENGVARVQHMEVSPSQAPAAD